MPDKPDLDAALTRLERLIGTFENEADDGLRERVFELLQAVDDAHRPLVWSVAERIHRERPELFEALLLDPVASVLFEMYGLVSPSVQERPDATATPSAFVGLEDLEATIPVPLGWHRAAGDEDVPAGVLVGRDVEGTRVLLARDDAEIRAFLDACPDAPMPLSPGALRDGAILCPWHDCRFDVRTGARMDREGRGLTAVPVNVVGGDVRVAIRPRRRSAA